MEWFFRFCASLLVILTGSEVYTGITSPEDAAVAFGIAAASAVAAVVIAVDGIGRNIIKKLREHKC